MECGWIKVLLLSNSRMQTPSCRDCRQRRVSICILETPALTLTSLRWFQLSEGRYRQFSSNTVGTTYLYIPPMPSWWDMPLNQFLWHLCSSSCASSLWLNSGLKTRRGSNHWEAEFSTQQSCEAIPAVGFFRTSGHHLLKQLRLKAYRFSLAHSSTMTEESLDLKNEVIHEIIKGLQDGNNIFHSSIFSALLKR